MPEPRRIDWAALKTEILGRLNVGDEYASLGIVFTGHVRTNGWRECRAFGRKDKRPSAAVNMLSGYYKCDGGDSEVLSFFDFAIKYGDRGGWLEVIEYYADKAGVPMPRPPKDGDKGYLEATYDYTTADGQVAYEVIRYRKSDGGKTFRIRRPDGAGGYIWSLGDTDPLPYRLVDFAGQSAEEGAPIYVVEGEKDADRLAIDGIAATCNHGGTGNTDAWARLAPLFAGRDCYIVPDNDPSGRDHAAKVAAYLYPHATLVKIVDLPNMPSKGDVSDFLDIGNTIEDLGRLANRAPAWSPESAEDDAELDRDATAADLIRLESVVRWIWPNWIPRGVLTALASEPGIGKTRLCADWLRRVALGLPWPDGSPQTCPAGSCAIWVPADNQHPELGTLPDAFGFSPDLLYLNATRRNPFIGTMLDSAEDLHDFEARIKRLNPALVFIDTSLNATDRGSSKPEDAKAFFKPLQEIASRTQTAIVCVTHLNAAGKPLGRRIMGQVRVAIQLSCPDPDGQPNRRKLWVTKSNSLTPAPLGVTMGDTGNDYDTNPPEEPPEEGRGSGFGGGGGAKIARLEECVEWLRGVLDAGGSVRVSVIRRQSDERGFSSKTLYRARDVLLVNEFELEGKKWWQLTADD